LQIKEKKFDGDLTKANNEIERLQEEIQLAVKIEKDLKVGF